MKPANLIEFYKHEEEDRYYPNGLNYGEMRQRDLDIALNSGEYEIVKLNTIKYKLSGYTNVQPLEYNWFAAKINTPHDLAHVISPDARIPNYTKYQHQYLTYYLPYKDIIESYEASIS